MNDCPLEPFWDRIIAKQQEPPKSGLLWTPKESNPRQNFATIVAVGPGRMEGGIRMEPELAKGQTIIYGKYGTIRVKYGDEEYVVVRERDVLGVMV
jgi:chaperonin GroES